MAEPSEIPEKVAELIDLSREYLRQETIEPAKRLGRFAGFGMAGGFLFALSAVFGSLAAYAVLRLVLPDGDWWIVLARGLTVVVTGAAAGFVGWRMTR